MRRGWLRRQRTQSVVVYTTDEHTLEGVIERVSPDGVVLFDSQVRSDDDVALAGLVFVPRERIRFVQLP